MNQIYLIHCPVHTKCSIDVCWGGGAGGTSKRASNDIVSSQVIYELSFFLMVLVNSHRPFFKGVTDNRGVTLALGTCV